MAQVRHRLSQLLVSSGDWCMVHAQTEPAIIQLSLQHRKAKNNLNKELHTIVIESAKQSGYMLSIDDTVIALQTIMIQDVWGCRMYCLAIISMTHWADSGSCLSLPLMLVCSDYNNHCLCTYTFAFCYNWGQSHKAQCSLALQDKWVQITLIETKHARQQVTSQRLHISWMLFSHKCLLWSILRITNNTLCLVGLAGLLYEAAQSYSRCRLCLPAQQNCQGKQRFQHQCSHCA